MSSGNEWSEEEDKAYIVARYTGESPDGEEMEAASAREIAEEFSVSGKTILNLLKSMRVQRRPRWTTSHLKSTRRIAEELDNAIVHTRKTDLAFRGFVSVPTESTLKAAIERAAELTVEFGDLMEAGRKLHTRGEHARLVPVVVASGQLAVDLLGAQAHRQKSQVSIRRSDLTPEERHKLRRFCDAFELSESDAVLQLVRLALGDYA